jgi:hypothetical protein
MSTGYEFSGDKTDHPFQVASQVDRMVRVITVRHSTRGILSRTKYMCINTRRKRYLPESFIDQSRKKDLESALLRKIKDRENVTCVFSEDKPLLLLHLIGLN